MKIDRSSARIYAPETCLSNLSTPPNPGDTKYVASFGSDGTVAFAFHKRGGYVKYETEKFKYPGLIKSFYVHPKEPFDYQYVPSRDEIKTGFVEIEPSLGYRYTEGYSYSERGTTIYQTVNIESNTTDSVIPFRVRNELPVAGQEYKLNLSGKVELEMLPIQAGTFTMGSPTSELERGKDENQHKVELTTGYWLGKTEVTQGQWEAVMGSNPSRFKLAGKAGKDLPVENVSWAEAMEFCRKVTAQEGLASRLPEGYLYSLPTEAQWEYACRAGTNTMYSFGSAAEKLHQYGNYCDRSSLDVSWQDKEHDDGAGETACVGSYKPNAWGFYDMHGNVSEYCLDWYGDYPSEDVIDPMGPGLGKYRLTRGGNWFFSPKRCRSADRSIDFVGKGFTVGFRLVLTPIR